VKDVAEQFVLLNLEAKPASGSQILTRDVGVEVGSLDVLVGVDADRQKHLLIPVVAGVVSGDRTSRGVTLEARVLEVDSSEVTYADLHCRISPLERVFERLVEDVLNRLSVDSTAPVATCRTALDDWRALLRAAGQSISREKVIGLVGELEVLRLLAQHDPAVALDAWRGPSKSVHDFVRGNAELEVKTTTSVDGNFISISNIDQLDSTLVESLHLLVIHAREDPEAPNIDERIDDLVARGVPGYALLEKVADTGYVYGSGVTTEDRFRVRSIRVWLVGASFPGLRRSEVGEARLKGVSRIRYELALDSAPKRMKDKEFDHFLAMWVSGQ
jgi:hypothetical protein